MNKQCKAAQETIMRVYAMALQHDYEIMLCNAETGEELELEPKTARACILAGIMCGAAILEDVKGLAKEDTREIFICVLRDAATLYLRDHMKAEGKADA